MNVTQFAKISEVREGTFLIADAGFTCIKSGDRLRVEKDENGELYVACDEKRHYLDGQIGFHDRDRDQYVGLVTE